MIGAEPLLFKVLKRSKHVLPEGTMRDVRERLNSPQRVRRLLIKLAMLELRDGIDRSFNFTMEIAVHRIEIS